MGLEKQMTSKTAWYDGTIYDRLIAPQVLKKSSVVLEYIEDNSSVLDVGCGTGSLTFALAEKCKDVIGIDLSFKMIKIANNKNKYPNVDFIHGDACQMSKKINKDFDLAMMVMFLHESDEATRENATKETLKLAHKLIIYDFNPPFPMKIRGIFLRFVESIAGKRHKKNFNHWIQSGGVDGFAKIMGLNIDKEIEISEYGKIIIVKR